LSEDVAQTVKDMAKLVLVSGKISEIHEKNMKMYAFVFFNDVKEVKIDYDLSHEADALVDKQNNLTIKAPKRSNSVTYHLTVNPATNTEQDHMDKRFSALEASIRTLFWRDVIVEVMINEKSVYKSKK
jgi:hypothetical protein